MQASKTIGHFVLQTHVKEVLTPAKISKLFDLDFNEAVRDDKGLSHLHSKFLNNLRSKPRVDKLKRRLQRHPKCRDHYQKFMKGLIDKGHAKNGRIWYIPHHGVYHPQKPDKIIVVFDASSEFEEESLNKHLLQGPDLTNDLFGVLSRFRKEHVAFMCDIEGMFLQVQVAPEHRNFLRFL